MQRREEFYLWLDKNMHNILTKHFIFTWLLKKYIFFSQNLKIVIEFPRVPSTFSTWPHSDLWPHCEVVKSTFLCLFVPASSQAEAQFMGLPTVELQQGTAAFLRFLNCTVSQLANPLFVASPSAPYRVLTVSEYHQLPEHKSGNFCHSQWMFTSSKRTLLHTQPVYTKCLLAVTLVLVWGRKWAAAEESELWCRRWC